MTLLRPAYPIVLVALLGSSALAMGCAASHWDEACGGPQPALAECGLGVYSADCGGDGEPVFACEPESATCRWFRGACVAEGFVVSDCPASDRCCHATPEGTWPFADGMVGDRYASNAIVEDIAVIGSTPITDESPLNLTVTVDPTLVSPSSITVTCVGETAPRIFSGLCDAYVAYVGPSRVHDTFAFELSRGIGGTGLLFEILIRPDGIPTGRLLLTSRNDDRTHAPVPNCAYPPGLGVAPSGTLVMSALSGPPHGRLEVPLADGSVTVTF